jgi:hypothetical protein
MSETTTDEYVDAESVEYMTPEQPPTAAATPPTAAVTAPQQAQAITPRENPAGVLGVAATFALKDLTLNQIWGLAKMVAGMEMCPRGLRIGGRKDAPPSVPDIAFVLIKGAELDLSMTVSLAEVSVIDGKLVLSSHLMNALVMKRGKPKIFRIIESTEARAVLEVQRAEWETPTTIEFTMEEAKALGLPDRGREEWQRKANAWNTQPKNMLRRRVIARGAREFFGEVVIAYDPDELEREETPAPSAWSAAPAAGQPARAPAPPEAGGFGEDTRPQLPAKLQQVLDTAMVAIRSAGDRPALTKASQQIKPIVEAAAKGDPIAQTAVDGVRAAYNERLDWIKQHEPKEPAR